MKTKKIDCVEMKREVQEQVWKEAGECLEGLVKLFEKSHTTNPLLIEMKTKQEQNISLQIA